MADIEQHRQLKMMARAPVDNVEDLERPIQTRVDWLAETLTVLARAAGSREA